MKKIIVLFFASFLLFSCKEEVSNNKGLSESSGNINNVSIFIDEPLWNGEIGDSLRKKLAAPVDGLPQEEPLFNINQYPTKIFDGFVKKGRNIIVVQKSDKNGFAARKDLYAYPQNVFFITGTNSEELIRNIESKASQIISTIRNGEIAENQRRMKKSLVNDKKIEDKFGLSLDIGYGYNYDMEKDKFIWLRKEFTSGYNSILIYEAPISRVEKDGNIVQNIINLRDSIGKANIHGTLDNTWMITEEAYAPYLFQTKLDNKFTYLTKGTWELKNDFMAGPFVNYAVKDTKNNRYLVIEGFTYLPSKAKRDHMFELEAIINSAKIK
ncbi:DUF4837 family protein [uncultured Flavobacterium sp.]|uniref:DUF4837 family protein n=1 Tax=uncultured Flavobacterium sp. TaxID=165435 RepID=UPI0030C8C814